MTIVPLDCAGVTPDPHNARLHTPRNIGVIEDSMQTDGAGRSILVDQHGVTIAGAGAWEAATQAGIRRAAAGFVPRAQIIWAKDRLALSRGDYHWQHEPCWYAIREDGTGHRTDDRTQSTLWTIPARDDDGHGHGTQKPVECMRRPMQNHLPSDVYDPFAGSGTTLIAAEQLGRRCFAIEIEPRYVQIAIDRWEAFTGQGATKV